MTFAVYSQVRHFDFVNFDDPEYVSNNLHVQQGLTRHAVIWAFTSTDAANWFPVTRLSHILDCQLFGLQSGWHHVVNVVVHALAALLLFLFLRRATGARWPSAFVAFVFALHPLHVESVAWVAERKDVLSAFLGFLTLWLYVRYAERPSWRRYLLVFVAFCLGLMAKPMLVTLPFVLLLLDFWPLQRFPKTPMPALIREKLSFFVLSAGAAVVTYLVQRHAGAVEGVSAFPIGLRIENALLSYIVYFEKTFWPSKLAVFYPYPLAIPLWQAAIAGAVLVGVSVVVLRTLPAHPYLSLGWLWYLLTLAPVIGLVQVGEQSRADRYMYIPIVGLCIMMAWGAVEVAKRWHSAKLPIVAVAIAACSSFAAITSVQVQHWRNSESLFQHAIDVTRGNYLAQLNLGNALLHSPGRLPEALSHLEAALLIKPNMLRAHMDAGIAQSKMGRFQEAVSQFKAALQIDPGSAIPHNDLGGALSNLPGHLPEAISEYTAALQIDPSYAEAHNNLGIALARADRPAQAIVQFEAAIRLKPNYAEAQNNLATTLSRIPGREADAISAYEAALRIDPSFAEAHKNLGLTLSRIPGRLADAVAEYQAALRSDPNSAEVHYLLAVALLKTGNRMPKAIEHFETALRIKPDYAEAHNNLGVALAQAGRSAEAISQFETALQIQPDYANAQYNLGIALSQIPGRIPDAISHLEIALRLKPNPESRKMIERLRGELR